MTLYTALVHVVYARPI